MGDKLPESNAGDEKAKCRVIGQVSPEQVAKLQAEAKARKERLAAQSMQRNRSGWVEVGQGGTRVSTVRNSVRASSAVAINAYSSTSGNPSENPKGLRASNNYLYQPDQWYGRNNLEQHSTLAFIEYLDVLRPGDKIVVTDDFTAPVGDSYREFIFDHYIHHDSGRLQIFIKIKTGQVVDMSTSISPIWAYFTSKEVLTHLPLATGNDLKKKIEPPKMIFMED